MQGAEWSNITLGDMLDRVAERFRYNEALVYRGRRLSYGELKDRVDRFAAGLLRLGVKKGDKVSIWMTNRPEWVYAKYAIAKIGAIMVAINTRFTAGEVGYILSHSDSKTLIMGDRFANVDGIGLFHEICPEVRDCRPGQLQSENLPSLCRVICSSEEEHPGLIPFNDVLEASAGQEARRLLQEAQAAVKPEDIVNILYTSGTTSFPKGAMLTHDNILRNNFLVGEFQGFDERERFLLALPLFGIFACGNALQAVLTHGGCLVIQEYFEPAEALGLIEEEQCTAMYGVPTLFQAILEHPDLRQRNLSSMGTAMVGAAPTPAKLIDGMVEGLGLEMVNVAYGLTETSAVTTMTRSEGPLELRYRTVGRPQPDVEVKIVDPETGQDLSAGKVGEVCVRGYTVTQGYYKKPEETAKALDGAGWFHTGDLGELDSEGYLMFRGRIKEMFKPGGFNVASLEVEEVLLQHPKVRMAYVVGVPDKRLGEVGMAFIELEPGQDCTEAEITDFCKARLANFKVPKYVKFTGEFPLTSSGKVQKYRLREMAIPELGLGQG